MPMFRRRPFGVRRVGRKRVGAPRYRRKMMVPRRLGIRQPVQFFRQTEYYPAWLTSATAVETLQQITFTLNAVNQGATFAALYDQYCIKGIKATLIPRGNVDGVSNPFSTPTWSCIDYDGSPPSSIATLNEYQNSRMKRGTDLHQRYLVPAVLPAIYNGVTTAYGPRKKQWIDCSNPGVPHYGLVFGVGLTPAQAISWDLKVEYFLAFKNVR